MTSSRHQQQQNLLNNGDFDVTDKQTGFVASWTCQGEQQQPQASWSKSPVFPMLRTMNAWKTAPFSGLCTERPSNHHGPSIDIRKL